MNLKNPRKFTYFRNPRKFTNLLIPKKLRNPRLKKVQKVAKGTFLSSAQKNKNLASKPLFLPIKGRHFLEALRGGTHSPKH